MSYRNLTLRFLQSLRQPLRINEKIFKQCRSCCLYRRPENVESKFLHVKHGQQHSLRNVSNENSIDDVQITETDQPDDLYRAIDVYIKGHEDSVLDSFAEFASIAAKELDITVAGILKPRQLINRYTLLKSVHIYKKHRVQYEAKTHKRIIQLQHLTGSTADVYLSYLQINIPAGVAMQVHKWAIESLPSHIVEAMEGKDDHVTTEDKEIAEKFRAKMKESKLTKNEDYEEYKTSKPYLIGQTI